MILYEVSYKKVDSHIWNNIKKVKGDLIISELPNTRILILEDETRIEIPLTDMMFKFSKERFYRIKENMENESGQNIKVNR